MILAAISDHVWEALITVLGVIAVAWINRKATRAEKAAAEAHRVILSMAKQLAKKPKK